MYVLLIIKGYTIKLWSLNIYRYIIYIYIYNYNNNNIKQIGAKPLWPYHLLFLWS